jgi:nucleotide-binding universal stress UspA family protein
MYRRIVVGTDGSATARRAVEHAAGLAALTDATLHVVHAYRLPESTIGAEFATAVSPAAWRQEAADRAHEICTAAAAAAVSAGAKVEEHVVPGDAADALIDIAQQHDADLLVVGNRGMNGVRRVLGSVPNTVSHHCPCNLLILHTT